MGCSDTGKKTKCEKDCTKKDHSCQTVGKDCKCVPNKSKEEFTSMNKINKYKVNYLNYLSYIDGNTNSGYFKRYNYGNDK